MEDTQLESILKQIDVVRAKLAEPSEDARTVKLFRAINEAGSGPARVWCFDDGTWCADCFLDVKNSLLVSSHCDHPTLESALTELLAKLKERAETKKEPEPDPVREHFDAGGIVRWGVNFYRKHPGKDKAVQCWSSNTQEWCDIVDWGSEKITTDGYDIPPDSEIPELAKLGDCQRALLGGKWVRNTTFDTKRVRRIACMTFRTLEARDNPKSEWEETRVKFADITDDRYTIVEPDEEAPND